MNRPVKTRPCARCGADMVPKNGSVRYCADCKDKREWERRHPGFTYEERGLYRGRGRPSGAEVDNDETVYLGPMPWIGRVHSEDWQRVGGKYRPAKKDDSLSSTAKAARAAGMSYGMYVARCMANEV